MGGSRGSRRCVRGALLRFWILCSMAKSVGAPLLLRICGTGEFLRADAFYNRNNAMDAAAAVCPRVAVGVVRISSGQDAEDNAFGNRLHNCDALRGLELRAADAEPLVAVIGCPQPFLGAAVVRSAPGGNCRWVALGSAKTEGNLRP